MMTNKNTIKSTAICLVLGLLISACGQKGPLIVDRPPEDLTRTQEGLPNEISPDDGSESESEAGVEVESEVASDTEASEE